MDSPLIQVSVIMLSYNHEKYISKAIESVLNQKTSFEYEIIIHDDASTDNSASIIHSFEERYPNKIRAIYQIENQYSRLINIGRVFIYPIVKGKYIATCECDDYWSSEDKLQKQYDCLEHNPQIVGCSHNCNIIDSKDKIGGKEYAVYHYCKTHIFDFHRFECGLFPGQTAALMYRVDTLMFKTKQQEEDYYAIRCQGDQKLALHLLLNGNIYYYSDIMSSHRVVRDEGDSWTARIRNKDMALYMFCASRDLRRYAKKYYGITLNNHYITFHRGLHIIVKRFLKPSEQSKRDYYAMKNEIGNIVKTLLYIIANGFRSFPFFIFQKIERNKYDILK